MTTPIEVGATKKTFDWIKNATTYVFKLAKRVATLEERVTALEERLSKQPGAACPHCGELAMRLTKQPSMVHGDKKQWKEEIWTCGKCSKTYNKHVPI